MPRLTPDTLQAVIDAIRAGRTVPEIHASTGVAKRTIAYHAAVNGLSIASRYQRITPGSYWHRRIESANRDW